MLASIAHDSVYTYLNDPYNIYKLDRAKTDWRYSLMLPREFISMPYRRTAKEYFGLQVPVGFIHIIPTAGSLKRFRRLCSARSTPSHVIIKAKCG